MPVHKEPNEALKMHTSHGHNFNDSVIKPINVGQDSSYKHIK